MFFSSSTNILQLKINSLPSDKIFDWSKLKAFVDDTINVNEKFKFGLGKVENIVGKGENAGYQMMFFVQKVKHKIFDYLLVCIEQKIIEHSCLYHDTYRTENN